MPLKNAFTPAILFNMYLDLIWSDTLIRLNIGHKSLHWFGLNCINEYWLVSVNSGWSNSKRYLTNTHISNNYKPNIGFYYLIISSQIQNYIPFELVVSVKYRWNISLVIHWLSKDWHRFVFLLGVFLVKSLISFFL